MFTPALEETRRQSPAPLVPNNQPVGRTPLKIDEFDRWTLNATMQLASSSYPCPTIGTPVLYRRNLGS